MRKWHAAAVVAAAAQAKALGDVLVVGLIPDSEIRRCKGPPVLNENERYLLVDAIKWVDEVITGEQAQAQQAACGLSLELPLCEAADAALGGAQRYAPARHEC